MFVAFLPLLIDALLTLLQKLLFIIGKGLCWIVGFLTEIFEKVAGLDTVTYTGNSFTEKKLLIRVFFGNTNINTIYWGMALIGIVLCFAFTIVAVIRKSGDSGDKVRQSLGDILRNCFKSITIILLMNFIISATISLSSTLMDRINYLIVNAQNFNLDYTVNFSEEDYACMARSLNTIGNYSLNASYNSRYNLNSCYNDIRQDLKTLGDGGKFDVTYITTVYDEDKNPVQVNTWQSVLQSIYRSVDNIDVAQPLDDYNAELAENLLDAMSIIKNDATFAPLKSYVVKESGTYVGEMVSLDRMIMLLGSMYGTGNKLAKGSGMTDDLRAPYYYGQKEIFDYGQCDKDFDMSIGSWLYLTVIIVAILFIREMLSMVFNAAARIFNMLLLYVSSPPFLAVTPLDDGGKLKQWTTSFIIQSFGLFGTIISLRLVMIFIPLLFSGDIRFFEGDRPDVFARIIIMYAAILTASKASGMIVGMLADNAGMQAISAGDMGMQARAAMDRTVTMGKMAGGVAAKAVVGVGRLAVSGISSLVKSGSDGEQKEGAGTGNEVDNSQNTQKSGGTPSSKLDIGSRSSGRQAAGQGNQSASGGVHGGAAQNNVPENRSNMGSQNHESAARPEVPLNNYSVDNNVNEAVQPGNDLPENKASHAGEIHQNPVQKQAAENVPAPEKIGSNTVIHESSAQKNRSGLGGSQSGSSVGAASVSVDSSVSVSGAGPQGSAGNPPVSSQVNPVSGSASIRQEPLPQNNMSRPGDRDGDNSAVNSASRPQDQFRAPSGGAMDGNAGVPHNVGSSYAAASPERSPASASSQENASEGNQRQNVQQVEVDPLGGGVPVQRRNLPRNLRKQ